MRLTELHKIGKIQNTTNYEYLYHLTNAHGFAYSIENNALRGLRHNTVSTTYDPTMNSVLGYHHNFFKLILDAPSIANKYGIYTFDHRIKDTDGNIESANEHEMRVNNREVSPLTDFCKGIVLLLNIFSERAVLFLSSSNVGWKPFLDEERSGAITAIEAYEIVKNIWKLPVYVGRTMRPITPEEIAFLDKILKLTQQKLSSDQILELLVPHHNIIDFDDKQLTIDMIKRRKFSNQIETMFHDCLSTTEIIDIDPNNIRKTVEKSLNLLGYGNNTKITIMHELEKYKLFNPYIAPVEWSIIFNDLIDTGDIDQVLDDIKFIAKRNRHHIERYAMGDRHELFDKGIHYKTRFRFSSH